MPFPNKDTQFQPGNTVGAKGRPMRPSAQVLQKILDETPFEKLPPRIQKKIREAYGDRMIREAMGWSLVEMVLEKGKGAVSAHKEIRESHEGKLPQDVDLTVPNLPEMNDGELARRVVGLVVEQLKSRQENGLTPPQPPTQGESTHEHQTPRGGGGIGSPADSGERR